MGNVQMRRQATSHFAQLSDIKLHYIKYANEGKPTLLLLHGLTANCHAFDGLVNHGLGDNYEIISVDLRGRGLSDQPMFGYSMKLHAKDMLELLRQLDLKEVTLIGHSYGGLLSALLCYYYPDTFNKAVFLDSAPEMNKKAPQMLQTALGRLDKVYESKAAFFSMIREAAYIDFWDLDMEAYFEADLETLDNGKVTPRPDLAQIMQVAFDVGISPLTKYFRVLKQPALLICATENYTMNEPILPVPLAEKAASNMVNCTLKYVAANHHTMVYGKYAKEVVDMITEFMEA